MYTVNLFGTGIAYWVCKMPVEEYIKLKSFAEKTEQDLETIFFDLDLIRSFGYRDWMNIHPYFSGMGMLLNDRNYIEIRKGNRRIRKINSSELNDEYSLFPIYSIQKDIHRTLPGEKDFVYVILVQFLTGLIRKYTIETASINLDDVCFYLNYQPLNSFIEEDWVTNISFKGALMDEWKEDTVVQGSRVFVLKHD